MNTNEQFGYDKLLTKEEFYLDVIYPNITKSAGIFYGKEEYTRARRNGNTIDDVIQQTFYYAYKPLVRGGKYGKAGGTIYDYYVENYFHVKNGDTIKVPVYKTDEKGKFVYEVDDKGKKHKIETGEYQEVPIKPCLNTIRAYMNTFVRNVLVDMCKVAENQKNLVSFDTPIGGEEEDRTLLDVFIDNSDEFESESVKDFNSSIAGEYLINANSEIVDVLEIAYSLEGGASVKEVCDFFHLNSYDVLNFFKDKIDLVQDCFNGLSDSSLNRLAQKIRRAKKEKDEIFIDSPLDKVKDFMTS